MFKCIVCGAEYEQDFAPIKCLTCDAGYGSFEEIDDDCDDDDI